ncbi:hypothetical protein ACLMJK_009068 [Lecanora helva]
MDEAYVGNSIHKEVDVSSPPDEPRRSSHQVTAASLRSKYQSSASRLETWKWKKKNHEQVAVGEKLKECQRERESRAKKGLGREREDD